MASALRVAAAARAQRAKRRFGSIAIEPWLREPRRRAATARAVAREEGREAARAGEAPAVAVEAAERYLIAARARLRWVRRHAHRRLAFCRPEKAPGGAEAPADGPPTQRIELRARTVFGSKRPSDVIVPGASPRHFVLTKGGGTFELRDFGHGDGPFVDGQPVKRALLAPGEHFDFGGFRYRILLDGATLEEIPLGENHLIVAGLNAGTRKKVLLTNMSFMQREKTVLAVLGPSGAGKTSLFAALVGELKPAGESVVYFREFDLKNHAAQLRAQLGFVPQEDHLFRTLTVRQVLGYAFRLRAPVSATRQQERIEDVCAALGISKQVGQLVGTLSGGERKRVSIAVELLTKPSLLMLDEPTSGLDAGRDREIMAFLRRYAREGDGHAVIVITHSVEHLDLAHQVLVIASEGRPVYSGQPHGMLEELHVRSYADLMQLLTDDPRSAAADYQNGPGAALARTEAARVRREQPDPIRPVGRRSSAATFRRQLFVLAQRQIALLGARGATKNRRDRTIFDWARSVPTVFAPLIIASGGAALAGFVSGTDGVGAGRAGVGSLSANGALSLLVTVCMLSGQALTYSDVVHEYQSIRRERRTGTITLAVLLAKWLVFAVIAAAQAGLITVIFVGMRPGPVQALALGPVPELLADLAAMTIAAMTLGLLISVLARKLEQAVMLATGAAIAQIALNGVASDLSGKPLHNLFSWPLPSRWGLSAAASSINLRAISPSGSNHDALWRHTPGQWSFDLIMLATVTVICLALATVGLACRLNNPE